MRLSRPHIRLLVLILREEYFRSPPGGPNRVRMTTTSLLQGLRMRQEVIGVVVVFAPRDPAVIIPMLHDLASVTIITIRLSLGLRRKRLGDPE